MFISLRISSFTVGFIPLCILHNLGAVACDQANFINMNGNVPMNNIGMSSGFEEKQPYIESNGSGSGTYSAAEAAREADLVDRKGSKVGEAAVMYGDVAVAEQYGYVERALKSRHIQFIALGGTIGTGLFVGIGKALYQSGPLSILLGYSIMGFFIYAMMQSLVSPCSRADCGFYHHTDCIRVKWSRGSQCLVLFLKCVLATLILLSVSLSAGINGTRMP